MEIHLDLSGNPILDQLSEEGFVDLLFRITGLVDDGTHFRFHLAASYNYSKVGIDVVMVKGLCGGFDAEMNLVKAHVYHKGVCFLRSGDDSDRLISAINELYGFAPSIKSMVEKEAFTVIALNQGDLDIEREPVKLKLFGKDGDPFDENDYYESFFNVDLANGFAGWNEKDPDYREPLLRALTSH